MSRKVYIVSAVRTPIGSFQGSLSSVPATALGATAIRGALAAAQVKSEWIEEVYMGQVLQAGSGQAPARQAALGAGLSQDVPCTTVNKVCASGMKAIALGAQAIALGDADLVVVGGMENMSSVPHYLDGRRGVKFGDIQMRDGMLVDGLTDVYNATHMGNCAELCAREKNITREEQDDFARHTPSQQVFHRPRCSHRHTTMEKDIEASNSCQQFLLPWMRLLDFGHP